MNDDTRQHLLECAERLFAERGIASVSMREINRAAGQRNTSAIHYHFGSKDALIQAIFEQRMREINARRTELLDEIEAEGRAGDLQCVLGAIILPLADGMADSQKSINYLLFFGQVLNESSEHILAAIRAPFSDGMRRAGEMVSRLLKDLPDAILDERMALATEMNIHSLAQRARSVRSSRRGALRLSDEAFLANLVDFTLGALKAPVSEDTRKLIGSKVSVRPAHDGEARPVTTPVKSAPKPRSKVVSVT